MTLVLIIGLVACTNDGKTPVDEGKNNIKDGTYKGVGKGKGGDIAVEVTIKDDTITDIKVLEQNETPGYETAMDTLTDEIISTNGVEVDMVSGCTLTSIGFLEAVKNALESAGATPEMLKKVENEAKVSPRKMLQKPMRL